MSFIHFVHYGTSIKTTMGNGEGRGGGGGEKGDGDGEAGGGEGETGRRQRLVG